MFGEFVVFILFDVCDCFGEYGVWLYVFVGGVDFCLFMLWLFDFELVWSIEFELLLGGID